MKLLSVLAVVLCGCATVVDGPKIGETWYVSTRQLALRAKPDALSPSVKLLKYRDAATVRGVSRVAVPFAGDKGKFPDTLTPNWVEVDAAGARGYLPVSSLASAWLVENQDPESTVSADGTMSAKRGFSESESGDLAAMRGFSESENGDLAAMRGAAGEGQAATAVDPKAVAQMLAARQPLTDADVARFASDGKLKNGSRQVVRLDVGKAETSFLKSARKLGAGGLALASAYAQKTSGDDKLKGAAASAGGVASGLLYSEIGPVQEYQLGLSLAARILPQYPVVSPRDKAARYVAELGATLAAASNDPMPYDGYSFVLVRSDEVNAFAVPGGFVFVTTGMLKFLRNEDELAAILGHEMGHMELRHGMSAVGKENVLKLFALAKEVGTTVAVGDKKSAAADELKALADRLFDKMTTSIRNGYGIEMESQADWRSVQFLKTLGYDAKALYGVLERFKAEKGSYGGASYPAERGKDVLQYVQDFGCGQETAAGVDVRAARFAAAVGK